MEHLERLGGGAARAAPASPARDRPPARAATDPRAQAAARRASRAARDAAQGAPRAAVADVALAGYTNVGKSTLLTRSPARDVSVKDRLFETLDPTTRAFEHDGRRYLVTDTVGLIRRLPHQLVEGFAATLEETLVADLVVDVADASAAEDRLERDGSLGRRRARRRSAPTSFQSSSC